MDSKLQLDAILQLASRYNYDSFHSHQVECLAGTIFMELREYHQLSREDRKLLEYAAILHDIGYYVTRKSHHRHTMMMILTEPLIPFDREDVKVIANVARYHRKALPTLEHTVFGTLNEPNRQKVRVLAGILRVADALDHAHKSLVNELTCEVTEDSVVFHIVANQDLSEEIASLNARGDLFREVFRKTPKVKIEKPRLASPQTVFQTS
jgi:exopolyphosphatase/guanosine-5'-triphosphate,3'-diphosphate pyrophosphatase